MWTAFTQAPFPWTARTRPRSGARHRMSVALAVMAATLCSAPILAQKGAVPPAPSSPLPPITADSKPRFAGQVRIAGRIADPGTTVQIIVFSTSRQWKICGEGEVHDLAGPDDANGFWYDAELDMSPECANPANRYDFYVNGVWGGAARYEFSPSTRLKRVHLAVPEVALRTPKQGGIKLFWIYGQVKKKSGELVPTGTTVTAQARSGSCSGTGKTEDVFWQPKGRNRVPFGAKGFYWIPIPMGACADQGIIFDVQAGNSKRKQSSANVHSPSYGTAVSANAVLDK
jgi:hypothetical protein